jgi:alkylhydroperoxidase family enzyme
MDAARYHATRESADSAARFDALAEYETSPLFTDAERAALNYATELTREKSVSSSIFARLQRFYSEREICVLVAARAFRSVRKRPHRCVMMFG